VNLLTLALMGKPAPPRQRRSRQPREGSFHRFMPVLREPAHTRAASTGVGCNCFWHTAFRLLAAIRPAVCDMSVADLASQCAAMTSLRAAELIARTSIALGWRNAIWRR